MHFAIGDEGLIERSARRLRIGQRRLALRQRHGNPRIGEHRQPLALLLSCGTQNQLIPTRHCKRTGGQCRRVAPQRRANTVLIRDRARPWITQIPDKAMHARSCRQGSRWLEPGLGKIAMRPRRLALVDARVAAHPLSFGIANLKRDATDRRATDRRAADRIVNHGAWRRILP